MPKKTGTPITQETLKADGWIITETVLECLAEKKIENRNQINSTPEDSDISLIVHAMYNTNTFAVQLPDGGLLNIVVNSMEELQSFEKAIDFYDPPF